MRKLRWWSFVLEQRSTWWGHSFRKGTGAEEVLVEEDKFIFRYRKDKISSIQEKSYLLSHLAIMHLFNSICWCLHSVCSVHPGILCEPKSKAEVVDLRHWVYRKSEYVQMKSNFKIPKLEIKCTQIKERLYLPRGNGYMEGSYYCWMVLYIYSLILNY